MIEARGITKRFGSTVAVDGLSFEAQPGRVTGFLGPNGAGKSTTMRVMLGLDRPDAGSATFAGRRIDQIPKPLFEVGALLDAGYVHPTRSARSHLRYLAASNGVGKGRADALLELVGLASVAKRRVGSFSLGMRQRLGIAGALLGDPATLLFDEPANGLDPEGIQWIRNLLGSLADEGRTVFVSSHLLGEMAQLADDLVVIGRGRLIAQSSVGEFVRRAAGSWVLVRSPDAARLGEGLVAAGGRVTPGADGRSLTVAGLDAARVGELAAAGGVVLHELTPQQASLEEAYFETTRSALEFGAGSEPGATRASATPASVPAGWPAPEPTERA